MGADADLVLVDPEKTVTLSDETLFYKNRWSPYSGLQVRASVVRTVVRGETVYLDGEIVVEPGFGRHVQPGGIAAELALTGDT